VKLRVAGRLSPTRRSPSRPSGETANLGFRKDDKFDQAPNDHILLASDFNQIGRFKVNRLGRGQPIVFRTFHRDNLEFVTSRVDQLDNHGALGDGDGDGSKSGVDRAIRLRRNGEGESRGEEVGDDDDDEPEQRVNDAKSDAD